MPGEINHHLSLPATLGVAPELVSSFQDFFSNLSHLAPNVAASLAELPDRPSDWGLLRAVIASEFVRDTILKEPAFAAQFLADEARDIMPERADLTALLDAESDASVALRRFRKHRMLAIAWSELAGDASLDTTLSALSELADVCLEAAMLIARERMRERFGELHTSAGEICHLYTICMGKLGGNELNFSSDIDVIFVYSGDGESNGRRSLAASEYTLREARIIIELLDAMTAYGRVFRVDTRLRPFGDSGPLTVSFAALEGYLQTHGRDWERYAFVKARFIAPQRASLAKDSELAQFRDQVLRPFVYRRYLDFGVLDSLRSMKQMIAREVARKDMREHLKLGPGGIREVEFIVQSWQLIRGGNLKAMRTPQLKPALEAASDAGCLTAADAERLYAAYSFLRQLENRLQALADRQTHSLPDDSASRQALALVMGADDWPSLYRQLEQHRQFVASVFGDLLPEEISSNTDPEARVDWLKADPADVATILNGGDADTRLHHVVSRFLDDCRRLKLEGEAIARLNRFVSLLVDAIQGRDDAALIAERVLSVATAVTRRSAYLSLLNEQPAALTRLIDIAAASESVTRRLAAYPLLLDELLETGEAGAALSRDMLSDRLARMLDEVRNDDAEGRMHALIRFAQAAWFRVAAADCLGHLPIMKVSDRLSDVAELILEACFEIAWADLVALTGLPAGATGKDRKFGIVGYGKLGGLELGYGSDLDIVFLHDLPDGETSGPRVIDNQQFVSRLARRLVAFLAIQTGDGQLYEIDTRLRPSGRKGFLVSSLASFERYQRNDAWTWEHQALTRARPVVGAASIARGFLQIRTAVLTDAVARDSLREKVGQMRKKMRDNLSRSGKGEFDVKQDHGGIADLEFLVQFLVLKYADRYPTLLEYTDNIRQLDSLADAGVLERSTTASLQQAYRELREAVHRNALNSRRSIVDDSQLTEVRALIVRQRDRFLNQHTD
ncbi:MAG: bifunctional [glutamate--ammonia ligase]-adenylyl-L-tyrosine phosphorylase/[glutamate--ammonia-ligase] adenylyltransferase [Pseudomonadota bacterium]